MPALYDIARLKMSQTMKPRILERDSHRCIHCGSIIKLELAHVSAIGPQLRYTHLAEANDLQQLNKIPLNSEDFRAREAQRIKEYWQQDRTRIWNWWNAGSNLVILCEKCHALYDHRPGLLIDSLPDYVRQKMEVLAMRLGGEKWAWERARALVCKSYFKQEMVDGRSSVMRYLNSLGGNYE